VRNWAVISWRANEEGEAERELSVDPLQKGFIISLCRATLNPSANCFEYSITNSNVTSTNKVIFCLCGSERR